MKEYRISTIQFLLVAFAFAIVASCEEVGPPIDFSVVDTSLLDTSYVIATTPPAQQRVVFMEEHTGVRCPNCPAGHVITAGILAANPDQIALVALHNYFADIAAGPLPGSTDTLFTQDAVDILTAQGSPFGWPAGTVNRRLYSGQSSVIVSSSFWSGFADSEMTEAPTVNIELTPTYDALDTSVTVLVKIIFLEDITEPLSISLMISESELVQPQDVSGTIDNSYIHEHVLRAMFTPPLGSPINSSLTMERTVIEREFKIHAPLKWDEAHLEVVGFVHQSGSSLDVLQAAKAEVM